MMEKFTGSSSISLLEIELLLLSRLLLEMELLEELLLEVVLGTIEVVALLEVIEVVGSCLEDGCSVDELTGF